CMTGPGVRGAVTILQSNAASPDAAAERPLARGVAGSYGGVVAVVRPAPSIPERHEPDPARSPRRPLAGPPARGVGGHARHPAPLDPDRRQGASRSRAQGQPLLARPAVRERARADHLADPARPLR